MTLKDEIKHNSLIRIIHDVCGTLSPKVWQEMKRENALDMVAADMNLTIARLKMEERSR